jgi:hypothetical protein
MDAYSRLGQILKTVQNLDRRLEVLETRPVNARQVITISGLSDIAERLGLINAGEFRAGNNKPIGGGFVGTRVAWPPMRYPSTSTASSDDFTIVGVNVDSDSSPVLQFGLSAETGQGVFGGGKVTLGVTGTVINSEGWATAIRPLRLYNTTTTPAGGPDTGPHLSLHIGDATAGVPWGIASLSYRDADNDANDKLSYFIHKEKEDDSSIYIHEWEAVDSSGSVGEFKFTMNFWISELQAQLEAVNYDDVKLVVGAGAGDAVIHRDYIEIPQHYLSAVSALSPTQGQLIYIMSDDTAGLSTTINGWYGYLQDTAEVGWVLMDISTASTWIPSGKPSVP